MKLNLAAIVFFSLCLSIVALGQQAKLEGNVFEVANGKETPVVGIRIIAPGGQSRETDSKGHFIIDFPTSIQFGQPTSIEVNRPGWVVLSPLLGKCTTQNPSRNFEPIKVIIVPKGSPLALEPKQLSKVVGQLASERKKLLSLVEGQKSQLDEYAFIRQYTEKYGFTLEQFRTAADQWAKIKESDDKEEQALKEYWRKNYERSVLLAREAALVADAELERDNQKKLESSRKVIRLYRLEGNALYEQYKFRTALAAYNKIEVRFSTRKLSKEDLLEEWAGTKLLLGDVKHELGVRVEGQESQSFLSESVKEYEQALTVYTREQLPQQWAGAQHNLGLVLFSQGERLGGAEGRQLLEQAATALRAALQVSGREQHPHDWAETQNNLGLVLFAHGERLEGAESKQLLEQAATALRAALQVYTREQLPQQWVKMQNNLGIILRLQGDRLEGSAGALALSEAIIACREALKACSVDKFPQEWAMTQNNMGIALRSQGERLEGTEGRQPLEQAATAFRAALQVYTREQLPQQWAGTQNNLGLALHSQGMRSENADLILNQAAEALRAALQVYTREQQPLRWAAVQNNLGLVLQSKWELNQAIRNAAGPVDVIELVLQSKGELNQAIEAFRAALQVYTREQHPLQWALTQSNLGAVLWKRGEQLAERRQHLMGQLLLEQAATAFRAALEVRTREQFPLDWAMTQNNLGLVFLSRGKRLDGVNGVDLLIQADKAFNTVLQVCTREQHPLQWAMAKNNLGLVLFSLAERMMEGVARRELLELAATAFRAALQIYTREQIPQQWAVTQSNLARACLQLRNWAGAAKSYIDVLTLYPDAEEAYNQASTLYQNRLFKFEEAFNLDQRWLARNPDDIFVQVDFAEKHFTTGRFAECRQRIMKLLAKTEFSASNKSTLQALEIASLMAINQSDLVPAKLNTLIAEISHQPTEFEIDRDFAGTRHFINQSEKLSPDRIWLNQLFGALAGKDRDSILKALRGLNGELPTASESDFAIPPEVKEKYPDLVSLILNSASMNKEERQYWFSIMPILPKDDIEKLRKILITEKKKLEAIDKKYRQTPDKDKKLDQQKDQQKKTKP